MAVFGVQWTNIKYIDYITVFIYDGVVGRLQTRTFYPDGFHRHE